MRTLPRHIMLVDLSQYMTDTRGMNPLAAYAYNNLLVYYWLRGELPSQAEALAFIAQIPLDAWSMLGASIMHAWASDSNGHFYHPKIRELRDDENAKALRRREHARKAAMARWHREPCKPNGEITAKVEHARACVEHNEHPLTGSPSRALSFLDPFIKSTTLRAREDTSELAPLWRRMVDGQHRSVTKAKPYLKSAGVGTGAFDAEDDGEGQPRAASVSWRAPMRRKQVFSDRSEVKMQSEEELGRFREFEGEVLRFWKRVNPAGPQCTWQEPETKALTDILREHPDLSLEQFKQCLGNVEISIREEELSASAAPRNWLPRVVEYLACPLDRYHNPIRKPAPRLKVPPRQL